MAATVTTQPVELIKGGETIFQALLGRTRYGITIDAKIHATIEEFFTHWAQGEKEDPRGFGRHWVPQDEKPLTCWALGLPQAVTQRAIARGYTITAIGQPLFLDNPNGGESVKNLSFLRIVGLSLGDGKRFSLKEICSSDELVSQAEQLQQAVRRFYLDFLQPKNVNIVVATQER